MKRILVTGAGGSAASNFVASLRLAPEPFYVVGVDVSPYHLELADVDARHLVPRSDAPNYLETLNDLITREGVEFVHAQPDAEVALLARICGCRSLRRFRRAAHRIKASRHVWPMAFASRGRKTPFREQVAGRFGATDLFN